MFLVQRNWIHLKAALLIFISFLSGLYPLFAQSSLQRIGLSTQTNRFDSIFDPMYSQSISYSKTTDFAELIGKLNLTQRFNSTGAQLELDAYPKFGSGRYAYVSYAYSNSFLFPEHRFGAEFYTPFLSKFEGSLGVRYLNFASSGLTSIYTGSVSYYYQSYLFSIRPFLIPNDSGLGTSVSLSARKYLNDSDFLHLRMGFGVLADQNLIQLSDDSAGKNVVQLATQSIGLSYQKAVGKNWVLQAGLGLSRDELLFNPGSFVLNTSIDLGFTYSF